MRPIIALLTDFGNKDGFVGAVKGVIKSINHEADIIDISHEITSFNIFEGSLVLNGAYKYFPEGSIFVCVVDPGVGTDRKPIAVKTEKYVFVAPDNGLLTLPLKNEKIIKIVELSNKKYQLPRDNETFHGRDVFAPAGAYISKGVPLEEFGRSLTSLKEIPFPEVRKEKDAVIGEIIAFDKFGNGITNIQVLPEKIKSMRVENIPIKKVCKSFLEGEKGQLNLIKGSFGFYEIFTPMESAKKKFHLSVGNKVIIKY